MVDPIVSLRAPRVSGRTKIPCTQCGRELWLYASQIKQSKRHFCTRQCRDIYRALHHWGNPRAAETRKCDECGAEIYRPPSRAASYEHHFCDGKCRDAWRAKHAPSGSESASFRGGSFHKCDQCGTEVWVVPARARKHKQHFCGADCRNAWLSRNTRGERSSNFKGGEIQRNCVVCEKTFLAPRAEVARGRGNCCSRECFFKSKRNGVSVLCKVCGESFTVYTWNQDIAKFCSRKCKHASQRKVRTVREIAQRRLRGRMSTMIWQALKGRKAGRSWETMMDYTLAELIVHLEKRFLPGMSWDNIGEWHVDHKRPCSSFTYDSPDDPEFKACWALDNLQPLWAVDNLKKHARLDWKPDV